MGSLAVDLGDFDVSCEAKLRLVRSYEELVLSVVLDSDGRQEGVALIDSGVKLNFTCWDVVRKYNLQKYVHQIKSIEVLPALRDSSTCEHMISVKLIVYTEKPIEFVLEAGLMENLSRGFYLGLPFVNHYQMFSRYP